MQPMDDSAIAAALTGPHQAVLGISRTGKGPLAVPMSFFYEGSRFAMITSPSSLHGKLITREGRATLTIHGDSASDRNVHHWYVVAEGPIAFTDRDPTPLLAGIIAKDRPGPHSLDWVARMAQADDRVVELRCDRIRGYEAFSALDLSSRSET